MSTEMKRTERISKLEGRILAKRDQQLHAGEFWVGKCFSIYMPEPWYIRRWAGSRYTHVFEAKSLSEVIKMAEKAFPTINFLTLRYV